MRALFVLALMMMLAAPSAADPFAKPKDPQARNHLKLGNKFFEVKKYDMAVKAYQDGYLLEEAPVFLHNLARVYRKKGDFKSAIHFYEDFLNRARDADPNMRKTIRKLADRQLQR